MEPQVHVWVGQQALERPKTRALQYLYPPAQWDALWIIFQCSDTPTQTLTLHHMHVMKQKTPRSY